VAFDQSWHQVCDSSAGQMVVIAGFLGDMGGHGGVEATFPRCSSVGTSRFFKRGRC
jgi:hypothetical protein